jgi:hypothetical protein
MDEPGTDREVDAGTQQYIDQQVIPDRRVGPLNRGVEYRALSA